ncbi:uncharacterized protein TNCV_3337511 [Trichonephila clavipes]|nr:uncharacterized protein TNCV_3337511 [Trichonephila clavipes]
MPILWSPCKVRFWAPSRTLKIIAKPCHQALGPLEPWLNRAAEDVGCGSPVVKVSDRSKHIMSSSPEPLKTRRVGQRCTLNLSRAQSPPVGVVWLLGEGVRAQVSSSSLDHGLKLRSPSPKTLV